MKMTILMMSAALIASCSKLNEDQYDEHIERPQVDIEVPLPEWDSTPDIDNELEFDIIK